jgi:hypothetical protein
MKPRRCLVEVTVTQHGQGGSAALLVHVDFGQAPVAPSLSGSVVDRECIPVEVQEGEHSAERSIRRR